MAPRRFGDSKKGRINIRIFMRPSPRRLAAAYREFSDEFRDFTPAWLALQPIVLDEERRIFASRGAPLTEYWGGKFPMPWPILSHRYARYRHGRVGRRKKTKAVRSGMMSGPVNRAPTLMLTGKLFSKLMSPTAFRVKPMSMVYGVRAPGAAALMFGGPRQRPFLGRTKRILGAANQLLHSELDRKIDVISSKTGKSREEIMATGAGGQR